MGTKPTKKTRSKSKTEKPADIRAAEAWQREYDRATPPERKTIDVAVANAQRDALAYAAWVQSPEATAEIAEWEAKHGEPWPGGSVEAWERLCVRAGVPVGHFLNGIAVPKKVRASIEGYLLRVQDDKRRAAIEASDPATAPVAKAGYLGISIDEDKFRATRNGKTADFASNVISWKLFCFMYRRKDAYASQQDLLRAGWTDQHIVAPETVQRHISTIRSIVKRLSVEIENERNVGYRLIEKKTRA